MDYGGGVWGNTKTEIFDNVNNRAMRVYLGVHKFNLSPPIMGDIG